MNQVYCNDGLWKRVGVSRVRSNLLRHVGDAGHYQMFVRDGRVSESGPLLYLYEGRGDYRLYREVRRKKGRAMRV